MTRVTVALLALLGIWAAPSHPLAQPLTLACATIRPGETAASIAARVTGDARSRHEPWFQILDPATSRVVRKEQYDRIRAGWRACVVGEPTRADARGAFDTVGRAIDALDSTFLLWAALAILIAIAWSGVDEYATGRRRMLDAMRRFGETFTREFERPLIQPDDRQRPIQSRLRPIAHQRRLEVLLAPAGGRRYPNLSDHRKNVAYDVRRVLHRLQAQPFVCSSLYAEGPWVVVRFEFQDSATVARGSKVDGQKSKVESRGFDLRVSDSHEAGVR